MLFSYLFSLLSFPPAAVANRRVLNRNDFLCLLDCTASGQADSSGVCGNSSGVGVFVKSEMRMKKTNVKDDLRKVAANFVNVSAHQNNKSYTYKSYPLPMNAKIRYHNLRFNHSQSSREELGRSQTKDISVHSDGTPDERLTHTDAQGKAKMVDVGGKNPTQRKATASATVVLGPVAFRLLRDNQLAKGDALAVAQLAGIMASKQTSALIPLCHPLPLDSTTVTFGLDEAQNAAVITATCQTTAKTGVEMEALTAASVAALTVYDMCKAVSHDIIITDVKLLSKTGGKRDYPRSTPSPTPGMG